MLYGYARVSTTGQDLSAQIALLKKAGAEKIYQEKFTGTTLNRPVFSKLLKQLKQGDQLLITKLDRFARNTKEAEETIQTLSDKGVIVNILNLGIVDTNTPTGKFSFSVFSAIAQFDRDMIITRTQEGKEYARKHNPNYHEGRKEIYSDQQIEAAYKLHKQGLSLKELNKKTGISIATLCRRFNKLKETKKQ
ncbi:recombinase family protein (plasmid) [Lactobacillus sp. ESL0731]|uniref:recombinase family protein n=1 Tax=unclassified Lactobacillus TaxID=2620435 RepID=UPI0023F99315|nr:MULTISPECIES: recombinase family protein [unclassified Lactobacillus]WEV52077.1 recombinase family protein [Lactobacillus sp. ESL0700]WEV63232.1 recombinase family protein [Lactobacillus sp. ESL0731]